MKQIRSVFVICFALLFCGCVSGCVQAEEEATSRFFSMNTYITMTAYGQNAETALENAEQRINGLESRLSVTDTKSEVYALNHSGGKTVTVGQDTVDILSYALTMAKQTGGALDPTIYPVLAAWGFTTDNYQIPESRELSRLLERTGYGKIRVSGSSVVLPAGMEVDLGAVAKGYTGDIVADILKEYGVSSAFINLGGNVQTVGSRPDGAPWRIGVRMPGSNDDFGILAVKDCAVVTSGNYQKYFTGEDGKVYGHIIDPKTGYPVDNGLASVTVIGNEGKLCDALSTALFVMGKEAAIEYWKQHGGFEMLLMTEDQEILITEGLDGVFSLREDYASLSVTVIQP